MVAGAVAPPKLELANEDLIQAHVQAVWLASTGQYLGTSLRDVLDVSGDNPSLELLPSVKDAFQNMKAKAQALESTRSVLVSIKEDLQSADWYSEGWVEEVLNKVVLKIKILLS